MSNVRTGPLLLLMLAAGGIGGSGCQRGGGAASAGSAQTTASVAAVQVGVTPARVQPVSEVLEVTGALNALRDVTVGVKAGGKLAAVYFREGDVVRAGQVVAQQDPADLQAQVDAAHAQVRQAQANLALARARLEQARVAEQSARTTLRLTDEQTRASVKQAEASLVAAQQQAAIVEEGARPQERQQAEENVAAARADRDKARADLKRYQALYREQAISAQQLDQAQAIADAADARYNAAVQALSLIREGARQEERRRAQAQVDQAREALAAAVASRDQVKLRQADLENARAGVRSAFAGVQQAQAALQQAQASLRLAEQALRDTAVVSPIHGVVAERKAEPGTPLSTAKPDVMRIVDLDSIYFDAQLSETQYARVRAGMPVTIRIDALPGRTFPGRVAKIFPVASATARAFTVRIAIQNQDRMIRPQMFARGEIRLATRPNAVVVPRDALLDYDRQSGRIMVARGSRVEERRVRTGVMQGGVIEIVEGLRPGERVITTGQAQVRDGDTIEVVADGRVPRQISGR